MKLNNQQLIALASKIAIDINSLNEKNYEKQLKDFKCSLVQQKAINSYNKAVEELIKIKNLKIGTSWILNNISGSKLEIATGIKSKSKIYYSDIKNELILASIDCKDLKEITFKMMEKYTK